jgi:cytochrome oxidase Cu insertion factor (SCO1/SenC/PrrC family)
MNRAPIFIFALFLAAFIASGFWLRKMAVRPAVSRPRLGAIPSFSLPDSEGRTWSERDFAGGIWVVSSIPPDCAGCAARTLRMSDLQTAFERANSVRLATFVGDPKLQSPARLRELSREYGARAGRWTFLAGSIPIPGGTIVVADRSGQIRGRFDEASPALQSEILDSVGDLLREKAPPGR